MKCPSCSAVIDESYVASFGNAQSVSCPACGFMLATGSHDLFSTATEFKAVSGWSVRLAKGQEVHFDSEEAFGTWLKQTTVTPGDMICKDGETWESLGSFLLGQRASTQRDSQSYTVPPTTLDAPDPEDEFEEFDSAMETLDGRAETPRPPAIPSVTAGAPILSTAVGHEKRMPPPIPGRATTAYESADLDSIASADDDETVTIAPVTEAELSTVKPAVDAQPASARITNTPRTASPAAEHQTAKTNSINRAPTTPKTASNGGSGKLLVGLVVGAVAASLMFLVLKPNAEVTSPAQRVVVTQQGSELTLKDKEILETSERWRPYLALQSTTALQLKIRLDMSKETTDAGRAERNTFVLAAYAIDLLRTKGMAERQDVLALYADFTARGNAGALTKAFKSLHTALSTTPTHKVGPKSAVANTAEHSAKTEPSKTADGVPSQSETRPSDVGGVDSSKTKAVELKPSPKAQPEPKVTKTTPAKERATAKKDKATYSKMLRDGTRHLENGRLKDASIALRKAADIKPKAHAPQFKLGYVALNRGNLSQALRYFKKARDIKPRDRETLLGLGSVYEKMGRKDDARRIYERYQSYFTGSNDRRRIEYKLEKLGR